MSKKELIEKMFSKEEVVKHLASYVLYYQIALGRNVYETIQDEHQTRMKLQELNLTLQPNEMLGKVFEIVLIYGENSDFDKVFDKLLMQTALLHSLEDFVRNDTSLLNIQNYIELKKQNILENQFFDSNMKMQFLKEYPKMFENYKKMITDDYIEDLKEIFYQNS